MLNPRINQLMFDQGCQPKKKSSDKFLERFLNCYKLKHGKKNNYWKIHVTIKMEQIQNTYNIKIQTIYILVQDINKETVLAIEAYIFFSTFIFPVWLLQLYLVNGFHLTPLKWYSVYCSTFKQERKRTYERLWPCMIIYYYFSLCRILY